MHIFTLSANLRSSMATSSLAIFAIILALPSQVLAVDESKLEPSYVERRKGMDRKDIPSSLDLARWCRGQGLIREMLHSVEGILNEAPDNDGARRLLNQQRDDTGWVNFVPTPSALDRTQSQTDLVEARTELLQKNKKRIFKKAKKAFRFTFWSDLNNKSVTDYAAVMNRYYDHTRGFFGGAETKSGIPVRLYSKRSDYLKFYKQRTGSSGEHISGFYTKDRHGNPFLCFYDDAYEREDVFNTARHECTHLLLEQSLRGADVGHWLNEGAACFLAGNGLERLGSYPANCLLTVRQEMRTYTGMTLHELINTPYKDFTGRHYSTAWAWVCYISTDTQLKRSLTQFFLKLREKTRDSNTDRWRFSDWEQASNQLFEEVVGHPERLQAGFGNFVEKDLEPRTENQKLHTGLNALQRILYFDPKTLPPAQKTILLRESEGWLRSVCESEDPQIRSRARLEEIRSYLARAACLDYNELETSHAAAEVASRLDKFVSNPSNDHLADEVARVAHQTLQVIRNTGRYKPDSQQPYDLLADMTANLARAMGETEKTNLSFSKDVAENLITLCSQACKIALQKDPGHRPACSQWLWLGLDFAPKEIEEVLPHLLFQVQLDPDDIRLASLATVYSVLGKHAYARPLFDRALLLTPKESSLSRFAAYVIGG